MADDIKKLAELFQKPLDVDHPVILTKQLAEIESWGVYIAQQFRQAERELAKMKDKFLLPKDKGLTEMDREVRLDASVAQWRQEAAYLSDLADLIKRRISLGQTILNSHKAEIEARL